MNIKLTAFFQQVKNTYRCNVMPQLSNSSSISSFNSLSSCIILVSKKWRKMYDNITRRMSAIVCLCEEFRDVYKLLAVLLNVYADMTLVQKLYVCGYV
jgi:hypothetical protein